jgi:hypothetical protein
MKEAIVLLIDADGDSEDIVSEAASVPAARYYR